MEKENLIQVAKKLIVSFIEAHKSQLDGRKGLMVSILLDKDTKHLKGGLRNLVNPLKIQTFLIGEIPREKQHEKWRYAEKKVERLFVRNLVDNKTLVSSFELEDIAEGIFGGGVRIKNGYLSCSGFPPDLDQKFVLLLALNLNLLSFEDAWVIDSCTKSKQQEWEMKRN